MVFLQGLLYLPLAGGATAIRSWGAVVNETILTSVTACTEIKAGLGGNETRERGACPSSDGDLRHGARCAVPRGPCLQAQRCSMGSS